MLATLLWIVFIVDSILLVLIVLLQSGRGGGLSGMLGGGGMAEAALGPKTGLPKITAWMAAIFFVSAILIGYMTRETPLGLTPAGGAAETKETGKEEGGERIKTRPLPHTGAPAAKGAPSGTPSRVPAPTPPETE